MKNEITLIKVVEHRKLYQVPKFIPCIEENGQHSCKLLKNVGQVRNCGRHAMITTVMFSASVCRGKGRLNSNTGSLNVVGFIYSGVKPTALVEF